MPNYMHKKDEATINYFVNLKDPPIHFTKQLNNTTSTSLKYIFEDCCIAYLRYVAFAGMKMVFPQWESWIALAFASPGHLKPSLLTQYNNEPNIMQIKMQ